MGASRAEEGLTGGLRARAEAGGWKGFSGVWAAFWMHSLCRGASGDPGSGPQQQGSLSCLWLFGPGSGLEGEDDVVRPLWGAPGVVVRVVSVARA